MKRDVTFTIEWNSSGIPLSGVSPTAHVQLDVADAATKYKDGHDLPPQIGTISLRGNREGLLAIAERLVAVAYTDVETYHEHLDDSVHGDFLDTNGEWEILIERSDVRAIRRAIQDGG